jgi:hypothetical protein
MEVGQGPNWGCSAIRKKSTRAEDEEENIKVIKVMHAMRRQVLIVLPAIEDGDRRF